MTILFPIVASLVAWLLSGSAVPMVLTLLVLGIVGITSMAIRLPAIVTGALVFIAALTEFWLFRTGEALATDADLNVAFHLAIALLWWEATDSLTKQESHPSPWIALVGSLLLVGSAASTDIYRYGPWLINSIAALPLAAVLVSLPNPRKKRFFVPVAAAITLLSVGVGEGTEELSIWIDERRPSIVEEDIDPVAPTETVAESSDGTSRRLPRDADISFDNRIEFYLRTTSSKLFHRWLSEPLYVRVSTVTLFENNEIISPARSGRWLYDEDDGELDNTVPLTETQPSLVDDYTLLTDRKTADALPLVRGTTSIAADMLYEYADGWYQLSPPEGMDLVQFTLTMPTTKPVLSRGSGVFSFGAAEPGGVYLNLPDTALADRIRELCREFDDERLLQEIRDHIFLTTEYSLKFDTPDGMSPVENFLFGEGRGHCEIYAAATVMMLRSVGIPSRLAYGYAGGAADRPKGIVAFRDSDSHAWAEILRPGGEWEIFDTVPQTEMAANRVPDSESIVTLDPSAYYDFSNPTIADAGVAGTIIDIVDFLTRNFLWVTLAGLLLLGALWWRVSRKEKPEVPKSSGSKSPEPDFVPEFLGELEQRGEKKSPGSTWMEYARKLNVPDSVRAAIDYYYAVRYAGAVRDREAEASFLERIREWRSA